MFYHTVDGSVAFFENTTDGNFYCLVFVKEMFCVSSADNSDGGITQVVLVLLVKAVWRDRSIKRRCKY